MRNFPPLLLLGVDDDDDDSSFLKMDRTESRRLPLVVVASLHTMVDLPMTALVLLGGTKASEIADCDARATPKTRDLTMIGLFVWCEKKRRGEKVEEVR